LIITRNAEAYGLIEGELNKIIEDQPIDKANFPPVQQPLFGNQPQQGYYDQRKKHWLNRFI
jgi:hypothetical protein